MKATNKEVSREVSNKQLASLAEYARRSPQGLEIICENLNRHLEQEAKVGTVPLLHRKVERAQVFAWLHPDARKRIEPQFGIGLLLIKVWQDVQEGLRIADGVLATRKKPKLNS